LLLEMPSVLIGARSHSHHNAAIADSSYILLDALFRNAPIAKRFNKAKRQASGDSACHCCGYGPSDNQTQAGKRHETTRSDEDRDDGTNCSPDGAAKFATLCCLAAQFRILITREVSSPGIIGHDQVDVPYVIAALSNGLVCALDTLAVSE
jgi:hypothetical protein